MRTCDRSTVGQNNTNPNVKKWLYSLTCTSLSSQWERVRDLTLLMSGMLRWIPEQSRQMNTPREQEPHPGSSEKKEEEEEERTSWIVEIQGYEEITFGGYGWGHFDRVMIPEHVKKQHSVKLLWYLMYTERKNRHHRETQISNLRVWIQKERTSFHYQVPKLRNSFQDNEKNIL